MSSQLIMRDVAWAHVSTAGAALARVGDITPARSGAGVYTLTLGDGGIDENECHVQIQSETAQITAQVVHTSDTVKTINTFIAAVATDAQFTVTIRRICVA